MRRVLALLVLLLLPGIAEASCFLKVSTAVELAVGPFVDSAGAAQTGLTISQADVRLKKAGGAWAQKNDANACTHEENGNYECALNTTDTNTVGPLRLHVNETGALPVFEPCMVLTAAAYDSLVSDSGIGLRADVRAFGGAAGAFASGRPEVNATHLAGTAQTSGGDAGLASSRFLTMIELDGGVYRYTTNAVEQAPTGGGGGAGATIMPNDAVVAGTTSLVYDVFIRSSTTGEGATGLTSASSGLTIAYARVDQGNADSATCTPQAATRGSFTSCGFVEKDATNSPGWYEFGVPNAAIATGADLVVFSITGVSGTTGTHLPLALVASSLGALSTKIGTPAGASVSADIAAEAVKTTAIKNKTDQLNFVSTLVQARVDGYAAGQAPLQPAVGGRTLNVTATGATAPDWSLLENASSTKDLTNTSLNVRSGGITSSSFASGAVNAAALATDAVDEIADGVWDEVITGHLTATTTGAALNAAGSAGDPWSTVIPGAYGAGTAGELIGNRLDTTVSSRATQSLASDIEADTQDIQSRLPASLTSGRINANVGNVESAALTQIADAIEGTSLAELTQGTPSATPTLAEAIMALYMALRNQTQTTSAQIKYTNDAGTVIFKCNLADDGTTFTKSECVAGP